MIGELAPIASCRLEQWSLEFKLIQIPERSLSMCTFTLRTSLCHAILSFCLLIAS